MSSSRTPAGSRHVVILGGGVGGLSTAVAVRNYLSEDDTVTVVDRHGHHVQGLSLLWVLRGWRSLAEVTVQPTDGALPGVRLLRADVQGIDMNNQTVTTTEGSLRYDALIIALGAELNAGRVPGLPEALHSGIADEFYTPRGAHAAHERLRFLHSGRVAVVVSAMPYKCPGAPWEAAFLTADLLRETGARDHVDLQIYTPEPQPMPVAGPVVGAALVQMLDAQNIGPHFNASITGIDSAAGQLTFATGEHADFDYALVIPPHQPPEPVRRAGFSDPRWIPVDAHTLTTSQDGVWALGDNASITLTNGKPLPKAAVFARGQATAVAASVARYLGREAPDPRFDGMGHCFLEVGGHLAAKGAGTFYAPGGADVQLSPPSAETHDEKQREEADWLKQWNTVTV